MGVRGLVGIFRDAVGAIELEDQWSILAGPRGRE